MNHGIDWKTNLEKYKALVSLISHTEDRQLKNINTLDVYKLTQAIKYKKN